MTVTETFGGHSRRDINRLPSQPESHFTVNPKTMSLWYPSSPIHIDSSASTITSMFGLVFPILRQGSPPQFTGVLQGIAAGIGISNFYEHF